MLRTSVLWVCLAAACGGGRGGGVIADGGGSGRACGGFAGTQCPVGEFCDFPRNTCGASDESGVCRRRPTACPDIFDPVCGCDGATHSNSCDAEGAGTDVNANGGCVSAGQFACGFRFCDPSTEFCQHVGSDVGTEPDIFTCQPLPNGCTAPSTPSCNCLVGEGVPCANDCSGDAVAGLTVVCLGG